MTLNLTRTIFSPPLSGSVLFVKQTIDGQLRGRVLRVLRQTEAQKAGRERRRRSLVQFAGRQSLGGGTATTGTQTQLVQAFQDAQGQETHGQLGRRG